MDFHVTFGVGTDLKGSDRAATRLQLVSDICDATVPSAATGLINFDDGVVGLAGTVSSLIGLTAQWEKTTSD